MTTTRFAPSPTGPLHLGHAYAAKVAHDLARENGGRFLLRQEDIDSSRVREEFYGMIEEDLKWLGLDWDGEILRQISRQSAYEEALESLKQLGLVYPCFCTRKDIQAKVELMLAAPHGNEAMLYPGICRALSADEAEQKIANGEAHSWRLDAAKAFKTHGEIQFTDLSRGETNVDVMINGDAVLARKDIGIAYHLAVVVDDEFQEITHVTRGEDLFGATHVQRQLQAILGYREPLYLHHGLVRDDKGIRLAKRNDALSIRTLREQGRSAAEVLESAVPQAG